MSDVFDRGECETAKGAIHLAAAGLMLLCSAYNALAWSARHEARLGRQALLYGAITAFEVRQTYAHWRHP